ncbi:MAG: DUF1501 domain-containing protein, partial [Rubripirellula sp.]
MKKKLHRHCGRFVARPTNRREMLQWCANGFGALALSALSESSSASESGPWDPKPSHFPARAKNVIFLYMDGGPSHVDTFDYKPQLEKYDGQDPAKVIGKLAPTQFDAVGKVLKGQWKFSQRGEAGHWISDLFPYLSEVSDDLAMIKSMTSKFSEHTSANYFLHTGNGLQGKPSMGAWLGYGLGSENQQLPGFVVLNGGLIPPGGLDCFGSGFLPSAYQGSVFLPKAQPLANIKPSEANPQLQRTKLDLIREFDQQTSGYLGADPEVEAAIQNYETAFQMQAAVPELMDLSDETEETKRLYGLETEFNNTKTFGMQCLLARRLVERGVRFIELTCPGGNGDRWDQHGGLIDGHNKNCKTVDQPIAALIKDLKRTGLFDSTLVVWAGEFGRTPFAQGSNGRDHNPFGFTVWMAGGGVKGGQVIGATDELGLWAVQDRLHVHDLHATVLHLLGIHNLDLVYRYKGRPETPTINEGEAYE